MDQTGKDLLKLMFNEGETICVSPGQFAYHAMPLDAAMADTATLVPTPESVEKRNEWRVNKGQEPLLFEECIEKVPSELLTLVALNPIQGYRLDANCYKYRNFLIELDEGEIRHQVAHIKQLGIPYSAMIFSGGKSIHTLISLEQDLPNESIWRTCAEWVLKTAPLADQNTKNPSRAIRIPGGMRDGINRQRLVEMKGKVKNADFYAYLQKYEHLKPVKRERRAPSKEPSFERLSPWIVKQLLEGIDFSFGRNRAWFSIACGFAVAGYSEEDTIDNLTRHFTESRTFTEKEWLAAIRSAFNYIHKR